MANADLLTPGQEIKPKVTEKDAIDLVRDLYGFTVKEIKELNAYDDKNYHVICEREHKNPQVENIWENGYVLKILNSLDSRNVSLVEAQNEMMLYLSKREIRCTIPVKNTQGSFLAVKKLGSSEHVIRLLTYQPGIVLQSVPITSNLLRNVGRFVARLDAELTNFSHPAYDARSSIWMLAAVPRLRDFVYALKAEEDRATILEIVRAFEERVLSVESKLERGIIHGDLNEQNILVDPDGQRVEAVIDFGDSHRACLIYELAITICYMLIQTRDLNSAKHVLEGFRTLREPTRLEKSLLKVIVCARLCQSLALGAYSFTKDPGNEYLLVTQKPGWDVLRQLWPMDENEVSRIWTLDA